jgi:hypothetical protein
VNPFLTVCWKLSIFQAKPVKTTEQNLANIHAPTKRHAVFNSIRLPMVPACGKLLSAFGRAGRNNTTHPRSRAAEEGSILFLLALGG